MIYYMQYIIFTFFVNIVIGIFVNWAKYSVYVYCKLTKKYNFFFALWKFEERKCRNENVVAKKKIICWLFFNEGQIWGIWTIANKQNFESYKWLITECHHNMVNYLLGFEIIIFWCTCCCKAKFVKEVTHFLMSQEVSPNLF
jgi:hypothetical protein